VPFRVTIETLNTAVGKWLPATMPLDEEGDGTSIVVREAVTAIEGGALAVDVVVDATSSFLSLENEAIRIVATPSLDEQTGNLVFSDIALASGEAGLAGQARTLMLQAAGFFMSETYSFALREEFLALEKALERALNRELTPELTLVGSGQVRARNLRLLPEVSELEVTISSIGDVQVIGFDPKRAE